MQCYTSRTKLAGLLCLTCVMVAVCYSCTTHPGLIPRLVGWIGVGFFGLGFVVIPVMFCRSGPQVVINDAGIEDYRLKVGIIRWEDVRSLYVGSIESARFLCIEVDDPEKYVARLPRWKRWLAAANEALGYPALVINFSGLTPGIRDVWAHLQSRGELPEDEWWSMRSSTT